VTSTTLSSGVVLAAVLMLRPLVGLVLLTRWGKAADSPSTRREGAPREEPVPAGSRN